MIGYADVNFLLSPTNGGLQEMLQICETYALEHGPNFPQIRLPGKARPSAAYINNNRKLRKLILCGNTLPWVTDCKHLGNKINVNMDEMKKEIIEKRAGYINKNSELCQEFYFSHPRSLVEINSTYNRHFTGSPLWDLLSRETNMIGNSWSTSIKIMYDIPRESHKHFLEPLCEKPHIRKILGKRFIYFTDSIRKSKKTALLNIFNEIKNDYCSVTGANLRQIMLKLNKESIEQLVPSDALDIEFSAIPEKDNWKVPIVKEIVDIKSAEMFLLGNGINISELEEILKFRTTIR